MTHFVSFPARAKLKPRVARLARAVGATDDDDVGGRRRGATYGVIDNDRQILQHRQWGRRWRWRRGAMPTRIGRGGAEQTEPMMMMMSASLGRGAGGRAQRATGSSTTAPRFNNCVEGLRRAFSLTFRAGGMVLFIPWRVAAARRAGSHRPARAGSHRPARAGWAALRRLADVAAFFLSESGSGRRWRRRWCGRRCRASSATGSPCATPRSQQHGKGRQQRFRFARNLHFANDLARFIYDADAGLLDRNVQSCRIAMLRFSF